jgi:predicted TIM-barrel fold metal-dependent hydrolase
MAELEASNKYVHEQIKKSSGRLIGFCCIDPSAGATSVEIAKRWIEQKGFRGVKLHPSFQGFFPNAQDLYPLYSLMENYRLPVLFHSGPIGSAPSKDKYSRIEYFDEVACDFPALPIILGHAGRPQYSVTANLLRKHRNVFADISANFARLATFEAEPLQQFLFEVKTLAGSFSRVLFGSDFPIYFQDETLRALETARVALNDQHPGFVDAQDWDRLTYLNCTEHLKQIGFNTASERKGT